MPEGSDALLHRRRRWRHWRGWRWHALWRFGSRFRWLRFLRQRWLLWLFLARHLHDFVFVLLERLAERLLALHHRLNHLALQPLLFRQWLQIGPQLRTQLLYDPPSF